MTYDEIGDGRLERGTSMENVRFSETGRQVTVHLAWSHKYVYASSMFATEPRFSKQLCLFVLGFLYRHSRHTRQSVQIKNTCCVIRTVHLAQNIRAFRRIELQSRKARVRRLMYGEQTKNPYQVEGF